MLALEFINVHQPWSQYTSVSDLYCVQGVGDKSTKAWIKGKQQLHIIHVCLWANIHVCELIHVSELVYIWLSANIRVHQS